MSDEKVGNKPLNTLILYLISVFIGIVAGLGAVVFRWMIAFFHNLFFLGKTSVFYDANIHAAVSPLGILVILVPVIGAIGVVFLVKNFAPEAEGRGVPEVMDAIYYSRGIIRPVVAVVKSIASALSIGSGGSVGREGPIIQIGATFGSTIGQIFHTPGWQRVAMIASGAGGGIAATFNTPIGGVLFAAELILNEISVRTLVPVAISTATATYIGRLFFGVHPSFVIPIFEIPYFHVENPAMLVFYAGLGIIAGAVSSVYIRSLNVFEDFFEKWIPGNYYIRHMSGMLLVGIVMYLFMVNTGHYYVEGVGYSTIQDILSGALSQLPLLIVLFLAKLFATSLSLGSGASGGIFSPSLFMGACLGGVYGIILKQIFPGMAISPPAFAVAGMAAIVGGATGAALAAIVMIFEMTLDYNVIVPMTITVALSYGIRKIIMKESIYTVKLVKRGHDVPDLLQSNYQMLYKVRDIMDTRLESVPSSLTLNEFVKIAAERKSVEWFLVTEDSGNIYGTIRKDAVSGAIEQCSEKAIIREIAERSYVTVKEKVNLLTVMNVMRSGDAFIALITDVAGNPLPENVKGLVTKREILDAIQRSIDMFET
jgi:CIC family chloride channel protein